MKSSDRSRQKINIISLLVLHGFLSGKAFKSRQKINICFSPNFCRALKVVVFVKGIKYLNQSILCFWWAETLKNPRFTR